MKMKPKHIAATTALIAAIGITGFAVSRVSAEEADTTQKTFVERLAEKLGLSSEAVQTATDEVRDEVHTERVSEAVESGDLTAEQAALLERIHEYKETNRVDHQAEMETLHALDPADRREAMEARHEEELAALAATLGVSEAEIEATLEAAHEAHLGGPKMGGRGGHGGRGMHGAGEGFGGRGGFGQGMGI